jgi:multidrug efflux pump subunit AcrA (membrane-fusion protein)
MNLVKKQDKAQDNHQDHPAQKVDGYAPVTIKEPMQQLMGLKTVAVQKKSLVKTIRAPGIVDPNFQASKSARTFPIYAQISEMDIPLIQLGQKANVEIPTFNESIQGIVRYIDWKVDPATRTVNVRMDVKGVSFKLRGNMFVNVTIPVKSADGLVIPRDSVMMTGSRAVVFIVGKDNSFHPIDIKTGIESEGLIQVKEGLKEGQKIVTGANFLLDSESRIQAAFK